MTPPLSAAATVQWACPYCLESGRSEPARVMWEGTGVCQAHGVKLLEQARRDQRHHRRQEDLRADASADRRTRLDELRAAGPIESDAPLTDASPS